MDNYNYDYSSSGTTTTDFGAALAVFMGFMFFILIISLAFYIVMAIFLGKIFKKAGVPSWVAWVPIYNSWKLLQIGGQPGWWSILAYVPFVNIVSLVFTYIAAFHIGKKLGKDDWFILLAIFLYPVWVIWLGADSSVWDESKGAPRTDTPTLPVAPPVATAPVAAPVAPVAPQETMPPAPTPAPADDQNQVPPAAPTL